jgi:hypothetical protein
MEDTKQKPMTNMERLMLAEKLNMLDDVYDIAKNTEFNFLVSIMISNLFV